MECFIFWDTLLHTSYALDLVECVGVGNIISKFLSLAVSARYKVSSGVKYVKFVSTTTTRDYSLTTQGAKLCLCSGMLAYTMQEALKLSPSCSTLIALSTPSRLPGFSFSFMCLMKNMPKPLEHIFPA